MPYTFRLTLSAQALRFLDIYIRISLLRATAVRFVGKENLIEGLLTTRSSRGSFKTRINGLKHQHNVPWISNHAIRAENVFSYTLK